MAPINDDYGGAVKKNIAFVEDDDVIRENYTELLTDAGFEVKSYLSRDEAWAGMQADPPDLVLLDVTLGSERDAGFHLCSDLRRMSATLPIVFLTSHAGEVDKISGLRLGADDYITKDASMDYIIVRLEALFRRMNSLAGTRNGEGETGRFDHHSGSALKLDKERCEAYWNGDKVTLTLTQYWMLECLYSEPGKVKRATELMDAAKIVVEPNTVVAHVKAIRDEFKLLDPSFSCVRTERGKGYRWLDD
jgi:two-component system OmpR family response regulator